jgi:hypothetical protein
MEKVGLRKADHAITCYSTALQNAFRRAARALGELPKAHKTLNRNETQ